jgi:hypothetical protein
MHKYLVRIEETIIETRTVEVTAKSKAAAENEAKWLYLSEASPHVSKPEITVTDRTLEAREIP